MDITSFKALLRDYNAGKFTFPQEKAPDKVPETVLDKRQYHDDDPALLRNCDYYEKNVGGL